MIVSETTDPLIIYGVRQIAMGAEYASVLLERGIWPKEKLRSAAAKSYIDLEVNRRGKAFELEIAQLVMDAGWRAVPSVPMKRLGAPQKLGDVDVLAVSADEKSWIIIECKWFSAARTPREIANWIQDYRGQPGDKVDRHLRRCSWIEANSRAVASALDIGSPMTISGRIVTRTPVPLPFIERLPESAGVWTMRELVAALKTDNLKC